MPIYEYKCANGHVFDVIQKMVDEPLTECQECDASAQRVLHPVAIHFKGSGFHNTDYKTKRGGADGAKEAGESKSSDSDSKPSESKPSESKSSESKPATSAASTGD